jgi:hypothetical protein
MKGFRKVAAFTATLFSLLLGEASAAEVAIAPWTTGLEDALVHWPTPFTATYKKSGTVLAFVAAEHVFTPKNSTVNSIAAAFSAATPALVILEGFPTAMGENPSPLVNEAQKRGTPSADGYSNSEAMYAASLALSHHVPFVGGEPTYREQIDALVRKGFDRKDITFAILLRSLGQSIRSGDIAGPHDAGFGGTFERLSNGVAHNLRNEPMAYADFSSRYMAMFGVDIGDDTKITERSDPGTSTLAAAILQADMTGRDEHLLTTIEQALSSKKHVLVVYGHAHWTTLSTMLQGELGKPKIKS